MARPRSRASGFSRTRKMLRTLATEDTEALRTAIRETADKMAETAREMVPVDTGDLRDSIEVVTRNKGLRAMVGPGVKSKKAARDVYYGPWIEFGTKGKAELGIPPMPARPYLGPAFLMHRDDGKKTVQREINAIIRKAVADANSGSDT